MQSIEKFIFDHFWYLFGFGVLWSIGSMGWGLWKRKQRGLFAEPPANVIYQERTASGRSHKNWFTMLGGASNCLRLVVTVTEIWVTPIFPFSSLGYKLDLDHRVALHNILEIAPGSGILRKSFLITYEDTLGSKHKVEISPRNAGKFEEALNTVRPQLDQSNGSIHVSLR